MLPLPYYRFLLSLAAFFAWSAHIIADFTATYTACPYSIVKVHALIVRPLCKITIDKVHKLCCACCTIRRVLLDPLDPLGAGSWLYGCNTIF
jgi:hypothetical protein